MLFNSLDFAIFLPSTFLLYWFVVNRRLRIQNIFLIAASYFFYAWWDWRFLSLLILSSLTDFLVGIAMSHTSKPTPRKMLLAASLVVNLGILGFFKYYNFFVQSFVDAFSLFGRPFDPFSLEIVLPVGISFYTFQTLSYTIDVFNRKIEPTRDIVAFSAFVCFFPQLVAGPIERARNLLPQFFQRRIFRYEHAADGMRQILWGLFKKVVIADSCALYVNEIFSGYSDFSGSTLALGAVFFAFQIYGDFSGYSDIAIGTAKLFGFRLMNNFDFPYFSRDIAEFWRRWHISLSSWFRDYLYIPLGGSRGTISNRIRNTIIIFAVSGFWHGANWTFIVWGLLHAVYFLPLLLLSSNRKNLDTVAHGRLWPNLREMVQMITTFFLTTIAWVFFRSESVSHAVLYIRRLFSQSLFSVPDYVTELMPLDVLTLAVFMSIEWLQRSKDHGLQIDPLRVRPVARWVIYIALSLSILFLGGEQQEFIYFQF